MGPENLRAAIGPNADYYLREFERLQRSRYGWVPSWNWPAFFFSTGWFFYRGMPWAGLASLALANVVFAVYMSPWSPVILRDPSLFYGYIATTYLLPPLFANALYFSRLRREASKPPSIAAGLTAVLIGPLVVVSFIVHFITGFGAHSQVRESAQLSRSLESRMQEFYKEKRRLPDQAEADGLMGTKFPTRFTRSIRYDAAQKAIDVVLDTWYFKGPGYRVDVQETGGELAFTCRSQGLHPTFIPRRCEN